MDKDESNNKDRKQEDSQTPLREFASPACYMSEFEEDFDGKGLA